MRYFPEGEGGGSNHVSFEKKGGGVSWH